MDYEEEGIMPVTTSKPKARKGQQWYTDVLEPTTARVIYDQCVNVKEPCMRSVKVRFYNNNLDCSKDHLRFFVQWKGAALCVSYGKERSYWRCQNGNMLLHYNNFGERIQTMISCAFSITMNYYLGLESVMSICSI